MQWNHIHFHIRSCIKVFQLVSNVTPNRHKTPCPFTHSTPEISSILHIYASFWSRTYSQQIQGYYGLCLLTYNLASSLPLLGNQTRKRQLQIHPSPQQTQWMHRHTSEEWTDNKAGPPPPSESGERESALLNYANCAGVHEHYDFLMAQMPGYHALITARRSRSQESKDTGIEHGEFQAMSSPLSQADDLPHNL